MSTSFPATKPEANLAKANAERIDPTCALFTPKDFAKSGIVGAMIPNPTATKKDAKTRTPTSRGNSAKGLVNLSLGGLGPFTGALLIVKKPFNFYWPDEVTGAKACDSGKFTP